MTSSRPTPLRRPRKSVSMNSIRPSASACCRSASARARTAATSRPDSTIIAMTAEAVTAITRRSRRCASRCTRSSTPIPVNPAISLIRPKRSCSPRRSEAMGSRALPSGPGVKSAGGKAVSRSPRTNAGRIGRSGCISRNSSISRLTQREAFASGEHNTMSAVESASAALISVLRSSAAGSSSISRKIGVSRAGTGPRGVGVPTSLGGKR